MYSYKAKSKREIFVDINVNITPSIFRLKSIFPISDQRERINIHRFVTLRI